MTAGTLRRRPLRTVDPVHVSYVLRLRQSGLQAGQFTGEIESVATGHSFPIASLSQLVAYVLETAEEDAAALSGRRSAVDPVGGLSAVDPVGRSSAVGRLSAVDPVGRQPAGHPVGRQPAVEP